MKVFANSDVGLVRKVNEDDYCVFQNNNQDWLAVVCDGIGGNAAGEIASHIVISVLRAVSYTHLTLPTICSV